MAFHVRRLLDADPDRKVALVCGAAHADRIRELVDSDLALVRPLGKTRCTAVLYHRFAAKASW